MNRADSVMSNDSLAEDLVSFFDKHGTPNERMRAHYILGRTYFDLGELPRALETYFDAADCADTTASDCDYKTLSRVHAQSAEVYSAQIQPRSMQLELRNAERYAKKANDSLMVIECKSQLGDVYKYLHKPDSVILIKESVASLFLAKGNERRYAQTLGAIISHLVEKKRNDQSKAIY